MAIPVFNDNQKKLKQYLTKEATIQEGIRLLLAQSALLHPSKELGSLNTYEDELWLDVDETKFRTFSAKDMNSVAWHLWHIARIEDIVVAYILLHEEQVLTKKNYVKRLNLPFTDTGNDYTLEQMKKLSENINLQELRKYRIDVGLASQMAIKQLTPEVIKRKVTGEELKNIERDKNVTQASKWLLDFWGRKDILGIIGMPMTRHILVHLNKAKRQLKKRTA